MNPLYYLCFSVNRLPDLTLTKYSVFDGSGVDNIIDKHGVFLRQLHRLGYTSGVYFHLLYYYNPDSSIPKGRHLSIIFYATSQNPQKLDGIREFLTSSVLSTYYDFYCYEVAKEFSVVEEQLRNGDTIPVIKMVTISGSEKKYSIGSISETAISKAKETRLAVCEIASDADVVLSLNRMPVDKYGKIILEKRFQYGAFLTKKDYYLPAQNRLNTDGAGEIPMYSIMEWEPCETGRLFNVLKLMEGYNRSAVLRIDIFPVEHTQTIRQKLPYAETRRRISDRQQGKDDNSETIVKSWDKYLNNLMKFPQFLANIVAFADSQDVAVMLADSVAAEAVESGTYLIESMRSASGYTMYEGDARILHIEKENGNYVAPFLSLYTLEEVRPMFSFPILYPGESIECQKETDPKPFTKEVTVDAETGEIHEAISLGVSSLGYDVAFPVELFKKHAFIAGVPGAGKTNTMLYLVTSLWRDTKQHVPFLVLEPAKQEYRALAMRAGMEDLCVFSPGADTKFPLHINPFEFPIGLTLAEHIANLNAVFAGAFELIPPSPFLIDGCIEKVYLDKGWNINARNDGTKEYPTMQELYDSLKIAVEESGYEGESKANIRSVMEVRIGSLLRREIGHVYNVRHSSIQPHEWLDRPVIIELESLGEGPANFMSLLISTLIREVLKIRKTSTSKNDGTLKREIQHIIFYEEAHNLIGPSTDDPVGGAVDPKISATKYLVKMLAEVRALGEGIVIADQLPTAMAAEVLKNTGLKLGHRITAQDDRNLLGSTMSASPEQLEEQGTFGKGQALIFYENLLKPFKMRVCEWEKGAPKTKYDSPSNDELFEHLKNNSNYLALLSTSSEIMQEKIKADFDVLRRQAYELKDEIKKRKGDIAYLMKSISLLEGKLSRLKDEEKQEETKKNISDLTVRLDSKKKELSTYASRNLKRLCWGYANQYYAYTTLAQNYYHFKNDMLMCVINNYLSLFSVIRTLHGANELNHILLDETQSIMEDLLNYIDYWENSEVGLLAAHPGYRNAVFDCNAYLCHLIEYETEQLRMEADSIAKMEGDNTVALSVFCDAFVSTFYKYYRSAQIHFENAKSLSMLLSNSIDSLAQYGSNDYIELANRIDDYDKRSIAVYKSIYSMVITQFKSLCGITGLQRSLFLNRTKSMMDDFRAIVDYRNPSTPTILSGWNKYDEIYNGAIDIILMEMAAQFFVQQQKRHDVFSRLTDADECYEDFKKCVIQCNALFLDYSKKKQDDPDYKLLLVNHFVQYLQDAILLNDRFYPLFIKLTKKNWINCYKMMFELISNNNISTSIQTQWLMIAEQMREIQVKTC